MCISRKFLLKKILFNKGKILSLEKFFFNKICLPFFSRGVFYNVFLFVNKMSFYNSLKLFKSRRFLDFFYIPKMNVASSKMHFLPFSNTLVVCSRSFESLMSLELFFFQSFGLFFCYSFFNCFYLNLEQLFFIFKEYFLNKFFYFCQFWFFLFIKFSFIFISLRNNNNILCQV